MQEANVQHCEECCFLFEAEILDGFGLSLPVILGLIVTNPGISGYHRSS
jgi:hypothetical protein